jgi:peptide deformylase
MYESALATITGLAMKADLVSKRLEEIGVKPIQNQQTPTVPVVEEWTPEILHLCEDLLYFAQHNSYMRLAGLAANQVGVRGTRVSLRACFVMTGQAFAHSWVVAINPEIVEATGASVNSKEGCLTWPGKFVDSIRRERVVVKYRDQNWNECIREATDFEALVWQHEINHLNGVPEVIRSPDELRAAKPNDPCPCKSGKKFKKCCGR